MASIDERVVQMRFENGQFEKNIQTSIKSIDQLKKGLDFDGAIKGLEDLDRTSKDIKFDPMLSAIETLNSKFTLLGMTGVRMLQRIADKAIDTGEKLVKSLSTDNISAGWDKYSDKTSAVQTIMSATASQFTDTGEQMEFVNGQLERLNWFTDETSYRFLDMVSNIGKFTSNNIGLNESVTAMQGIATWAAQSGANVNEAGRAMYNLSQAIAVGSVKLIDWKSIENANMATATFKQQVIEAAEAAGTLKKAGEDLWVTLSGKEVSVSNFNENLSEGWFTSKVLMDVLDKYGGAANAIAEVSEYVDRSTSQLIRDVQDYANGVKTAEEISALWDKDLEATKTALEGLTTEEMLFGLKAFQAAQETKTFAEAIDYVKEAVSTGWMNTFETIFGDYEEAKEFWSNISEVLYSLFVESGDARNEMLSDWADMGGRAELIDTIYAALALVLDVMNAIKGAWNDVFPAMTAERLFEITHRLHEFTIGLLDNEETMDKVRRTLRGLFAVLDIFKTLVIGGLSKVLKLFNTILGKTNFSVLDMTASFGDNLVALRDWVKQETFLNDALDKMIDYISSAVTWVKNFINSILEMPIAQTAINGLKDMFYGLVEDLKNLPSRVSEIFTKFSEKFKELPKVSSFGDIKEFMEAFWGMIVEAAGDAIGLFPTVGEKFGAMVDSLVSHVAFLKGPFDSLKGILTGISTDIKTFVDNITLGDVAMLGLAGGMISKSVQSIEKSIKAVTGIFDVVSKFISGMQTMFKKNLQARMIKTYAETLLVLAAALFVLSNVNYDRIWESIGVLLVLGGAMVGFAAAMSKIKASDIAPEKFTMMAGAILALAVALATIGMAQNVARSLGILTLIIAEMAAVSIALSKWAKELDKGAATMVGFAASILLLTSALKKLGKMDVEEIKQGLPALIVILGTMAVAMRIMNGNSFKVTGDKNLVKATSTSGAAILALVVSAYLIIGAIKKLNKMNPEDIIGGLIALGGIFLELGVVMKILAKTSGKDYAKVGGTLLMLSLAVNLMVPAVRGLAKIDGATMQSALINLGAIGLVFTAAIAATKLAGQYSAKAGLMLLELAAALAVMPIIVRLLGGMDTETLVKGTGAVVALGLMFTAIMAASKNAQKSTASIIAMAGAIGILAIIVYQLTKLDFKSVISSAGALALVMGGLAIAFASLNSGDMKLWQETKNIAGLYLLIGAVALLSTLVKGLAAITNPAGAIGGATAIAMILPTMALSMKLLNGMQPIDNKVLAQLAIFGGIVAEIAVIVGILSAVPNLKSGQAIGMVTAISLLLMAMTGCFAALGLLDKYKLNAGKATIDKFNSFSNVVAAISIVVGILGVIATVSDMNKMFIATQIVSLVVTEMAAIFALLSAVSTKIRFKDTTLKYFQKFTLIAGGVAAVVAVLAQIPNINQAIPVAESLAILLPALTGAMYILAKSDATLDTDQLLQFLGFAAIASALGFVIGILSQFPNTDKALDVVIALDALIIPLSAVVVAISKIPGVGADTISKVVSVGAGIDALIIVVGGLMGLIGWIAQDKNVAAALESAPHYCTLLGEAIGGLFGGLVGGFVGGAIEGVADVLPYVGTKLSEFGTSMEPFFEFIQGLDDTVLTKANTFAGVITTLGAAELATSFSTLAGGFMDAISSFLGFDTDKVESFKSLGEGIAAFAEGIGDVDANQVLVAAEAANVLATLEDSLPPIDGHLQDWLGSKDIGLFGERLTPLAEGLADFAEKTEGITEESVSGAAAAADILIELERGVPRQGGYIQKFFGSEDIGDFGGRLLNFGRALLYYKNYVKDISEDDVKGSANAASMLIDLEGKIPRNDGVLQTFFGSQDFGKFGERLASLGGSLVAYIADTKDISEEDVKGSAAAISALAEIEKNLDTTGGVGALFFGDSSFGSFSKNLKDLGGALESYDKSIAGIDLAQMNAVTFALKALLELGDLIGDEGTWSSDMKVALDGWITAVGLDFESYSGTIKSWGVSLVGYIITGVTDGIAKRTISIKLTMITLGTRFQQAFNDFFRVNNSVSDLFVQNGSYIIDGLVKGIRDNQYKVTDSMVLLGNATNEAFKNTMLIASPSVVMKENGVWLVKGIAEGIDSDTSAEDAITKKAQNIASAFKAEIDRMSIYQTQASLAYQLWEANEGRNATDEEKTKRELDSMVEELGFMADNVSVYRAALEAAAKEFGETSQQYVEAENTMNQAILQMYQQRNEIEDKIKELKETAAEAASETSAEDRANAFVEYSRLMSDMSSVAEQLGYSQEQLEEFARQRSGYGDLNKAASNIPEYDFDAVMAKAFDAQKIEIAVEQAVQKASTTASTAAKAAGKTVGQSMVDGVTEGASSNGGSEEAGFNFLNGLANSLGDSEGIVSKASNLIGKESMINRLMGALDENSPSKEAYKIGDFFIQGLANGMVDTQYVSDNASRNVGTGSLRALSENKDQFRIYGIQTMQGFANGIREAAPEPIQEAERVAKRVSTSLMGVLGIASPSKVARSIGSFVSIGLAKGILDNASDVTHATEDLGDNAISMLEYTKNAIDDVLSADDDLDPVIRPVLDMDELKQQARNIPGILSSQNGISTRLADISAQAIVKRRTAAVTALEEKANKPEEQVTNYNFTQNNYSPTALNRKDIYRQTRNQFSQLKGATKR